MMDLKYKILEGAGWVNLFIGFYTMYYGCLRDEDIEYLPFMAVGVGAVTLGRYLRNNLEDKLDKKDL